MADHPSSHNTGHESSHDGQLEEFKKDLTLDADSQIDQRRAANDDTRFVDVDGGPWEGWFVETFTDKRVKLVLDVVSDFVQDFNGEWDQNRVGVEFKSDAEDTTADDSDLLNGIYRADFRQNSGKISTDNAVLEASKCGFGALKINTFFEDEGDPENDKQRIAWEPIYSAYNTVCWETSAKREDKRDARYCTLLTAFTKERFNVDYPGKDAVSAYDPDNWVGGRSYDRPPVIYIATRYEVKQTKEELFIYNDLMAGRVVSYTVEDHEKIKDELAENKLMTFVRKRMIKRQTVHKTEFSGSDILEPTRRIVGKWIPIIPIYAYRSYVDGSEQYRGLVRKLKDAARLWYMQVSQHAEDTAAGSSGKPIFDPTQIVGEEMQNLWANKNNKPYLLAHALRDKEGNIVQTGPIGYTQAPQMGASTQALLAIVPEYIRSVTGGTPTEFISKDMSGKAIKEVVRIAKRKTFVINDNIANAVAWSGTVYMAMAEEIYSSARIIKTIRRDGTEADVKMMSQEVVDKETGAIIMANDLRGKKFHSYADTGPQYETMREQLFEETKALTELLAKTPAGAPYMPVLISIMIENLEGVNLDGLREFNRKIMLSLGIVKPETDEERNLVRQQQEPKEDPQDELLKAAATQQEAEARSLDASSLQKTADANKKIAETEEIRTNLPNERTKIILDQQAKLVEQATRGLGNGNSR